MLKGPPGDTCQHEGAQAPLPQCLLLQETSPARGPEDASLQGDGHPVRAPHLSRTPHATRHTAGLVRQTWEPPS